MLEVEVNGKSRGLTNLIIDTRLEASGNLECYYYDPRKEIGVLQYGVNERYGRPSQIATSSTYYNGGCSAYYEYTLYFCSSRGQERQKIIFS